MDKIISEELLSYILKDKVKRIIGIEDNSLKYLTESYGFGEGFTCSINLCVLRDIMEEWTFDRGYEVYLDKLVNGYYIYRVFKNSSSDNIFHEESKIEAITKACQWIYDKEIKNGWG